MHNHWFKGTCSIFKTAKAKSTLFEKYPHTSTKNNILHHHARVPGGDITLTQKVGPSSLLQVITKSTILLKKGDKNGHF